MTHAEHQAADAATCNEADHGSWLDARIARGLDIALGVPVTLFAGPALPGDGLDWRRGQVAGRIAALSPFSLDRSYDAAASKAKGWVRVVNGGATGWMRRDELLSSIAVKAARQGDRRAHGTDGARSRPGEPRRVEDAREGRPAPGRVKRLADRR